MVVAPLLPKKSLRLTPLMWKQFQESRLYMVKQSLLAINLQEVMVEACVQNVLPYLTFKAFLYPGILQQKMVVEPTHAQIASQRRILQNSPQQLLPRHLLPSLTQWPQLL
ncbi:Uncharacterised protein [Chlamydia trachomatis]|nr:Uncharacterised protein [Chlamydia trachomatis]